MRCQPETTGAAFVRFEEHRRRHNVLLSKGIGFGRGSTSFPEVNHLIS